MIARLLGLTAILIGTAFAVTGAQDISVNEPDVCLVCHADLENSLKMPHVHTAFSAGVCSDCHNPHASRHAALLKEDAGKLCLECHESKEFTGNPDTTHRPVKDGKCLVCHDPHASNNPDQLVKPMADLCKSCHTVIADWMKRQYIHAPVGAEDCMACHTPHGGGEKGLLVSAIPGLCFNCHEQDNAFQKAHSGFQVANANCVTCHTPHASSLPSLLMPNQHAPFKGKRCDVCHITGGGSSFALKADSKTVCTQCHGAIKKIAEEPYAHNLNTEKSCMNCHNPHASTEPQLLSGPQTVICLKCHFNSGEYAAMPREKVLTHDGMDCTNCHQPHGSDSDHYLVDNDLELCFGCHEGAHKGSHPVGEDVIDPRTGKAVTCLSCHKLHGASFKPYLPLDPSMDLCIQCLRK
jgi:predicted CXXCH cytochrome family protein